jgi:CheY-like chemotaxis protein
MTNIAIAFFDITREVTAEEGRGQMQSQLAQAERLASVATLAAAVAHEVNNPLSYVIGSIDLIEREIVRADDTPAADRIGRLEAMLRDARHGADRVRCILAEMGQRIEEQTRSGRPNAAVEAEHTAACAGDPSRCDARPQQPAGGGRPRRASVLVVDDEPLILKVIAQMLGPEHDVTCESNGSAALDRIRRGERFDAIMCDLMMPQVTGMDLYDAVLEIAPRQAQAMLFLTGGAFTARAQAFLERIPNVMIEKPFDATTLLSRVRRVLG